MWYLDSRALRVTVPPASFNQAAGLNDLNKDDTSKSQILKNIQADLREHQKPYLILAMASNQVRTQPLYTYHHSNCPPPQVTMTKRISQWVLILASRKARVLFGKLPSFSSTH